MNEQENLRLLRQLVTKMGWKRFFSEVGSILAEQADKCSGDISSKLFTFSQNMFVLTKIWGDEKKNFIYPKELVGEEGSDNPFGEWKE